MDSTVRPRPNHYETLGLTPAATDADILQAFGRQMSMFRARPMSAIAQVSIAYETLRNPTKRRAYDASLGLNAEPEAEPPRTPAGPPPAFIGAEPRARSEGLPERRLGSFIAESLREVADASEAPEPQPEPEHRPKAESEHRAKAEPKTAEPGPKPDLGELLAGHRAEQEGSALGWKRPVMAAGALVLAVGLAGALLGWRGGEAPPQAEPDVAIALPAATPPQDVAAVPPPPAPPPSAAEASPQQHAAVSPPPVERAPPAPRQAAIDELQVAAGPPAKVQPEEAAVEQASAQAPAAEPAAAALPLPNATIARTIGRIGYACGEVASTQPVEGAKPGVFKVTCTSGQSYRAAPVRGRYHFRRWDRQ